MKGMSLDLNFASEMARHALQIGLLDGSILTVRDLDPPNAG